MDLISISYLVLRHLLERHSRLHRGVSGVHKDHDLLALSQELDGLVVADVVHLRGNHMAHVNRNLFDDLFANIDLPGSFARPAWGP